MSNLPTWLVESRENALKTQEWNDLTKNIYDAVDQHLAQNHVQYFTDLSDAEKSLLLERAAKSLKANQPGTGNPYENFSARLSDSLDKSVNNDVSRSLLKENPLETKSDLILDEVSQGIVALLRKWPDQKYKLHAFINQPLPPPIRFVAWHLFLNNNNHRQKFLNDLSLNPRQVLSPQDGEIQRQCDVLLRRLPSDYQMLDSRGNQSAMKAILSYHHSLFNNQRDLADAEFFYVIPIVLSHHPPLAKTEKPYEKSLAFLIEIYRTFLDTLPTVIREIYLNSSTFELDPWVKKVQFHLREIDRPLSNHLHSLLSPTDLSPSSSQIDDPGLLIFLKKCTYPWFKYFFVGALSRDPLMFVWDQYLLTSDLPHFDEIYLPSIAAALIISLRDFLFKCRSVGECEGVLKEKSVTLITRQLQSVIVRFFLPEWKSRLSQSEFGPVIDPTEGRQWTSFNRDHIPQAPNRPEQRINDREKNENLLLLERKLREEMSKRAENERSMGEKIDQLQREVDRLRSLPLAELPTRLSTPAERYLVQSRSRPITPLGEVPHSKQLGKSPIADLLRKIVQTANRVAHGEGQNALKLNEQTKSDIRVHKLDLKMAEREVIGRTLREEEWNQLGEEQKEKFSREMLDTVKRRIEQRYSSTQRQ